MKHIWIVLLFLFSLADSAWAVSLDCVVQDVRLNRNVDNRIVNALSPVGKDAGLPATYEPHPEAVPVPYEYVTPTFREAIIQNNEFIYMAGETLKAVTSLIDDAKRDNIELYIHSAYRPFKTQCSVFRKKVVQEMQSKATTLQQAILSVNTRSALPGESEHQLGTAADLVTDIPNLGFQLAYEMQTTEAYRWLQLNAYKFGFVLSYPRGSARQVDQPDPKTGYIFEPWHWRFIGTRNADKFQRCQGVSLQDFLKNLEANPNFECPR